MWQSAPCMTSTYLFAREHLKLSLSQIRCRIVCRNHFWHSGDHVLLIGCILPWYAMIRHVSYVSCICFIFCVPGALWGITLALILNALFLSRISFVICQVSICLYFSSVPVQMRIVLMWVSPHVRQCNTLLWLAIAIFGTLFGLLSLTGGNDTTS